MIVTVTANPSIDRTIALAATLTRGAVLRASGSRREPGGKGINVARAVAAAGDDVNDASRPELSRVPRAWSVVGGAAPAVAENSSAPGRSPVASRVRTPIVASGPAASGPSHR